jgi:hypothetical protein
MDGERDGARKLAFAGAAIAIAAPPSSTCRLRSLAAWAVSITRAMSATGIWSAAASNVTVA